MMRNLRRFWRWFRCDHRSGLSTWTDGAGWNVTACAYCGRCWLHIDGADAQRELHDASQRTDGVKP